MPTGKIAVTLEEKTIREVDRWVREGRFPNRSRALQAALDEMTRRHKRGRIALEAAMLDRREQQELAEAGLGDESWPEY